uniref:Putative DUF584 protein n=1 Tax=Linum usitatissimum TaxID=4006 RepID=I6YI18_LINUS|nr:putative DUF584 protein [Linum usitatissimum]
MSAEELHESDIIFPCRETTAPDHQHHNTHRSKKKRKQKSSVPVNIPRNNVFRFGDSEEEYEDSDELVPPHVILGRRVAGKMAFSVCTGNGRTLKGRDLSQVRNSILRMTGFLET